MEHWEDFLEKEMKQEIKSFNTFAKIIQEKQELLKVFLMCSKCIGFIAALS